MILLGVSQVKFIATGDAVTATLGSVVASIQHVSTGPSTNNNQLITTALGSSNESIFKQKYFQLVLQ